MHPEIIEINPTELCNRKCSFCPRGSGYPNLNYNLSVKDAELIHQKLIEFNYGGSLHLTGSGEPTLNPNFSKIAEIFRRNKQIKIKMTTNGDYIGKKDFSFFKYFDQIRISVYDGDERYEYIKSKTKNYAVDIRKQYINSIMFNNCGGWFEEKKLENKTCYVPFYRMKIDWNLDIRFCCHDWKEKKVMGNLKNDSLENLWYKSYEYMRKELIVNNRKNISPCNKCNVNGKINTYTNKQEGLEHFNFFKKYYEET